MDNHQHFVTIVGQKHLWAKVTKGLIFHDFYQLSLSCKTYMEVLSCIRRTDSVSNFIDNYAYIIAKNKDDIDILKIDSKKFTVNGIVNFGENKRIMFDIFPGLMSLTQSDMEQIGQKINDILNTDKSFHVLSLRFTIDSFFEHLINHLIKEIRCDNIYTLDLRNVSRPFNDNSNDPLFIRNEKIFNEFINLRTIIIHPRNMLINNVNKRLVDVVSKIKGITIETDFNKSEVIHHDVDMTFPIGECLLSYILKKNIYLKINGPYLKVFNLNNMFTNLTNFEFSFIKSLRLDVSSITTFRKLTSFLPYMTNLEWIGLNFVIKIFPMQVEIKFLNKMEEEIKYNYQDLKHLNNLRTIQITFDFVTNFSHELLDDIIDGLDMSNDHKISSFNKREIETFKMCRKNCQDEILLFFSACPVSVEKVYLAKFPEFITTTSLMFNKYFPNLKLLFLEKIGKIEKQSLMPLKSLEIFVTSHMNDFALPKNIEICMICYIFDSKNRNDVQEKYEYLCKRYKETNLFTKECVLNDHFYAKILYNYFHSMYVIKNNFEDIAEMLDCNEQKQYYKST